MAGNLIEQMNILKGLSDEALQGEMQSPSGAVPPYLVLTEVGRRKDMRSRYEGEAARAKRRTTVAEDLVIPMGMGAMGGMPAGGIADAGVPGYATGGLVSYDEMAQKYNERLADLPSKKDRARALALISAGAGIMGGGHSNTLRNIGIGINAALPAYQEQLSAIDSEELALMRSLTDLGSLQNDLDYRNSNAARLSEASYAQTPIFLIDDKGNQQLAQPSTGGGLLINGQMYPGVPPGWQVVNRPVALETQNLGTSIGAVNTNLGPNAGAVTTVAPIDVSGKAFDEKLGADLGAQIGEARTAATDAQLSLAASQEALNLLDKGMITGFGADFRLGMGKALQQVGVNLADDAIANTEAFVATRALEVGRLIKLFGAGTGLSDADREYATKAAAGSIDLNEDSIRRIIEINNRAAQNVIDKYNMLAAPLAGRGSIPEVIIPGGQQGANAGGLPTPKTQAEFDDLPIGALYVDPDDGKTYRKD